MPNIFVDKLHLRGFYQIDEILRIILEFYGYEEIKKFILYDGPAS